jgi:hypothetical protein
MNPQAPPTREQVKAHLESQIAQRKLSLEFYEKQRRAKEIRFELTCEARNCLVNHRVAEAEDLEYAASIGQLDMMIVQTQMEIAHFENALKSADAVVLRPDGVVM